mgnify:FL=1
MKTNTFFKNTMVILFTSFVIKLLGLLNKIIITRLLGIDGMSLYVLTMPTLILLTSISSLSLNSVISKLISENEVSHQYSNKELLKKSILLSLISSLITIVILLIIIKPLTNNLLNNANLFFPILSSIILIPLVGISDALRGYFNGLKNMRYSSISTLIEQIFRILSTIILIIISIKSSVILSVTFCVIGLAIGEISSIIFSVIKIKKLIKNDYKTNNNETKAILNEAIPTTLSRLVSSFAHFLEPIIYTNILLILLYDKSYISETYTTISAYVIPFITLTSFVSNSVSTSIIPGISENYSNKNLSKIHYYIDKAIIFALIPGLFSCIIFYLFNKEYLLLLFDTSQGIDIIKYTVLLTIPYYLQMPFTSALQAMGKNKQVFILTIVLNVMKLLLIVILSIIPMINVYSLIVSLLLIIYIDTIIMYLLIKKYTKYHLNIDNIISILIIFVFIFFLTYLLKLINLHFILITLISMIITILLSIKFNLLNKNSFKFMKKSPN